MARASRTGRETFGTLLLIAALAGCSAAGPTVGPPTTPAPTSTSGPTQPATPVPSPSRTVAPTALPTASPLPSAASTPGPSTDFAASEINGDLVLSVEVGDTTVGPSFPIPQLSVYADGSVIQIVLDESSEDWGTARYAKLTAKAAAALVAEVLDSGVMDAGDLRGFGSWSLIQVRDAGELRTQVASLGAPKARRDAAQRVIDLADRLSKLDERLPASSWVVPPEPIARWVPANYMLAIRVSGSLPDAPITDVADITWPLSPGIGKFGDLVEGDDPDPPDLPLRCGVVTLGEALAVQAELANAVNGGWIPTQVVGSMSLQWQRRGSHVDLALAALLPHDPRSCAELPYYP